MRKLNYGTMDPFLQVDSADKILNEVFQVTARIKMKAFLLFGLCLGFVRDGGYIEGDNDLDVGVICETKTDRQILAASLREKGFVHGTPRRNNNVHFRKNKVLVDIYFLKPEGFYNSFDAMEYKGKAYPVPHPVEKFLSACYSNWRIKEGQSARILR